MKKTEAESDTRKDWTEGITFPPIHSSCLVSNIPANSTVDALMECPFHTAYTTIDLSAL